MRSCWRSRGGSRDGRDPSRRCPGGRSYRSNSLTRRLYPSRGPPGPLFQWLVRRRAMSVSGSQTTRSAWSGTRPKYQEVLLSEKHHLALEYRTLDLSGVDLCFRYVEQVVVQDDHVG